MVDGSKWIIYFRNFLEELGYKQTEPTTVLQDNLQVIRIIEKSGNQSQARGFDINYCMVQDHVKRGLIKLEFTRSRQMPADALNKPVGKNIFGEFCKHVGLG